MSEHTDRVLAAAYEQLVSAYAAVRLAASEGSSPETLATFRNFAQKAYDIIAENSPADENPAVTLLMIALPADMGAVDLIDQYRAAAG